MNNKTFFIIITILIPIAIISFLSYSFTGFDKNSTVKMSDFPKTIGEWTSEDIPLDQRVYELLETDNLIMRDYKNKQGETVNLYIIYSQDNRKVAHPPEICLQGEGATVVDKSPIQITNIINANKLILEKRTSRELAIYWYKVGKLNTNVFLKQQLNMAISGLFGRKTSIAMIRVIAVIQDNKQDEALNKIKSFCAGMVPLLEKYVP
jgi:EpsI family protein